MRAAYLMSMVLLALVAIFSCQCAVTSVSATAAAAPAASSSAVLINPSVPEHGTWYIDWTAWFTGTTFSLPVGVNVINVFVGQFTTDASGHPTVGGFGNMDLAALDNFVAYCAKQSPPIAVKVSLGGGGGSYDHTWDVLTTANTQQYAQGLVNFCHTHKLAGIDFDYESYTSAAQQVVVGTLISQFKALDASLSASLCTNAGFGVQFQWPTVVKTIMDAATTNGVCAVDKLYIMSYYNALSQEQGWLQGWSQWAANTYGMKPYQITVGIDDFDAHAYNPYDLFNWAVAKGFSTGYWAFDPAHPITTQFATAAPTGVVATPLPVVPTPTPVVVPPTPVVVPPTPVVAPPTPVVAPPTPVVAPPTPVVVAPTPVVGGFTPVLVHAAGGRAAYVPITSGIEHSVWYLTWTTTFSGSFVVPAGVNVINIYGGGMQLNSAGTPTIGGNFGNMHSTQLIAFVQYCQSLSPPVAVKLTIGGTKSGATGTYFDMWDQLTASNVQAYAKGMVYYARSHGLSGIDFDYEEFASAAQAKLVGSMIAAFKKMEPTLSASLQVAASFANQANIKMVLDAATTNGKCAVDKFYIKSFYDDLASEQAWIQQWASWLVSNYHFTASQITAGVDDYTVSTYSAADMYSWAASKGYSSGHWAFDPVKPLAPSSTPVVSTQSVRSSRASILSLASASAASTPLVFAAVDAAASEDGVATAQRTAFIVSSLPASQSQSASSSANVLTSSASRSVGAASSLFLIAFVALISALTISRI